MQDVTLCAGINCVTSVCRFTSRGIGVEEVCGCHWLLAKFEILSQHQLLGVREPVQNRTYECVGTCFQVTKRRKMFSNYDIACF